MREQRVKPALAIPRAATLKMQTPVRTRLRTFGFSYLLILPAVVILGLFHLFPIFYAFYISLHKWKIKKQAFVGLDNYTRALHSDEFWNAIRTTLWFVVGTVPIGLTVSLCLAIMLSRPIAGRTFYRVVLFLPYITPPLAMAIVWGWMYKQDGAGLVNTFLGLFGIGNQRWLLDTRGVFDLVATNFGIHLPNLLHGPPLPLVAIMIYSLWSAIGFDTIIFLAGLSNVPREVIEAAQIDGASQFQIATRVIAPLLRPTILFLSIISMLRAFQVFNPIYAMTLGGPAQKTETITFLIFDQFFQQVNVGYGAAIALLLFVVLFVITLIQLRLGEERRVGQAGG
ncbi:MAG: sugar ABC transporter permease [Chloroflexota bacterium]|nr:sugar ABC transporter permease [Chloroflexota bacterium]MDQ6905544.1 sugar ABC transporter permease [Chloroflexota bacterium]